MKILTLSANDSQAGAAIAAYRIHCGLLNIGLDSKMLVQKKKSDDYSIIGPKNKLQNGLNRARATIDRLPLKFYKNFSSTIFSINWLYENHHQTIQKINPDIVHLHWINEGFYRIENLAKIKKPIVWTLHDMWAFTGGCHYSESCRNYEKNCGNCYQLGSTQGIDLSRKIWERKKKIYDQLNLTVISPSKWLAECAKRSSLLGDKRIEVIPNGINIDLYKPIDKHTAKEILNLNPEKKYILFGAINATADERKGYQFLIPTLDKLSKQIDIQCIVFGSSRPKNEPINTLETHYLGKLYDDYSILLLYNAAEMVILPSMQENLPNIIKEAFACGCPCVAFHIGGIPEMIDHKKNGYLTKAFDIKDLEKGVIWVIENWKKENLRIKARRKAEENFDINDISYRYRELYQSLSHQQKKYVF